MNIIVPEWVLNTALIILSVAFLLCLYRLIVGPSAADRAISSDAIGNVVMCAISVYSVKVQSTEYFSAVLVIAILGFVGLTVIAKFLYGGDVIEHND